MYSVGLAAVVSVLPLSYEIVEMKQMWTHKTCPTLSIKILQYVAEVIKTFFITWKNLPSSEKSKLSVSLGWQGQNGGQGTFKAISSFKVSIVSNP